MMRMTLLRSLLPLLFLVSSAAFGAGRPQVALLISLDPDFYPKGLASLFHDYNEYPNKIEAAFRKSFENSDFDVEVFQGANVFDLYEAVTNQPETVGVFWVSHEAPVNWSKIAGVEINPLLVDEQRADVKSVFREINPNIRWVSLVACDSNMIVNWLKSSGPSESRELQGFDTEIDAIQGLNQAIQLSLPVLRAHSEKPESCISKQGLPVHVLRTASAVGASGELFFPSVTLEQNGQILGALQELRLKPGASQTQEQQIFLSPPSSGSWRSQDLRITIQSGLDPAALPAGFAMGTFSVSGYWNESATWKTFSKPDGTPFGVSQEILIYPANAHLPQSMDIRSFRPFLCE
jgi:hypothetical protein